MVTTAPHRINVAQLVGGIVCLAIGFASLAWTRLGIAIILPEVMHGIGVTSLSIGGLISTLTILGSGVCEPFFGRLSDVLTRRVALAVGLAGFSLFSLLTALATNLPEMLTVRILLGVGQGLYIPAYLAFLGSTFAGRRGFVLGSLGGMFTVGSTINPLATQAIYRAAGEAWQAPFAVYGVFGLVLALVVFILGRHRAYESGRTDASQTGGGSAQTTSTRTNGLLSRGMLLLLATMVCWGLTQYAYLGLFTTFLREQQHFTLGAAAAVASAASWISFLASFFTGWLSDHIGRRNMLLICGLLSLATSFLLFDLTGSFWPALLIAAIFQAFNGSFFTLGVAYSQDMASSRRFGVHSGIVSGTGHIMAGISGLVAGALADAVGFTTVGWEFAALSAIMVVCIFFTVDPVRQARLRARGQPRVQAGT